MSFGDALGTGWGHRGDALGGGRNGKKKGRPLSEAPLFGVAFGCETRLRSAYPKPWRGLMGGGSPWRTPWLLLPSGMYDAPSAS